MKFLLSVIIASLAFMSCKKDNQDNSNGMVVFRFQPKSSENLKSTRTDGEPQAAAIIVSIEKSAGGVVCDKQKLELSYLNGVYLTKGLALVPGNYNLTEFLVTDASNKIIYATPKAGSVLAQLVSKPLPWSFNTYAGIENILVPEVIRTDSSTLEDLGYTGFSFSVVKSIKFLMSVFTNQPDQPGVDALDSCNLSITSASGKTFNCLLKNGVCPVYLNDDSTCNYILNVSKQGYKPWVDTLSVSQLENYSATPIHVILKKLPIWISFLSHPYQTGMSYNGPAFTTNGTNTFDIDWGDGTYETMTNSSFSLHKEFDLDQDWNPFSRFLTISGNLNSIKSIAFFNPKLSLTVYDNVNLTNATSLEEITFGQAQVSKIYLYKPSLKRFSSFFSSVPFQFGDYVNLESISFNDMVGEVDIHENYNLKSLKCDGCLTVILGNNPNLTSITLETSYLSQPMTVDQLNTFLVNLLANVQTYPRAGKMEVYNPINPTNDGLNAAQTLKNQYNWTFNFAVN